MTCNHVIDLIDAGPFADYPRAHLEAAWQHARNCPTCGPALRSAEALTGDLRTLRQLAPPRDLAINVLARIAALEAKAAEAESVAAPSLVARSPDWRTAVGAMASTAAVALAVAGEVSMPGSSSGGDGSGGWLIQMPAMTAGTLMLAACLVLYTAGLLVSAVERDREPV